MAMFGIFGMVGFVTALVALDRVTKIERYLMQRDAE